MNLFVLVALVASMVGGPCSGGRWSPIPIEQWTASKMPCIRITVEGVDHLVALDLGFRGDIMLKPELIDRLTQKRFVSHRSMWGLGYKEAKAEVYRVPTVTIGKKSFDDIRIQQQQAERTVITQKGQKRSTESLQGKIGWEIFRSNDIFLDLKRNRFVLSDCFETAREHGYFKSSYVVADLLLEDGMIGFEAVGEKPLRCFIDTGCTYNFIRTENRADQPLEKVVWDKSQKKRFKKFYIGSMNVGKVSFHPLPIELPVHFDAILGIEFLMKHQLYIDFSHRKLYITR